MSTDPRAGAPATSLRASLAGHVERGEVPGLVALVSRAGQVEVEALGSLSIGGQPMRRDALFRIASMTKPMVAAAAMTLVDEGLVRLDEPVDRLLPELADRQVLRRLDGLLDETVPAAQPILVRDLFTFTPGYGIVMAPPGTYPIQQAMDELELGQGAPHPQAVPPPDEWLRRLGTLPLLHQPGEQWMYHTGADLLGVLIRRAMGQPLEEALRERLFAPLGMKDTAFSVAPDQVHRFATSYSPQPDGGLAVYDPAEGGDWNRPPAFPSGGGGLVSTADDCLAFGELMLGRGRYRGRRILSEAAVEAMITDQLTPAQKAASQFMPGFFTTFGWGLGLGVIAGPDELGRSVGTFGWDGGLGTSWYCDPSREQIGIVLTQRSWTSPKPPDVCRDFWRAVNG